MDMRLKKPYTKGARFERKVAEILRKYGFFVIRSAGSKQVDLVAIKDGKAILIECKARENLLTKREREKLKSIGEKYGCRVLLAYKRDGKIYFESIHPSGNFSII